MDVTLKSRIWVMQKNLLVTVIKCFKEFKRTSLYL